MKRKFTPQRRPLRCPSCKAAESLEVLRLGSPNYRATVPAVKMKCPACEHIWWSTHRDIQAAVQRFLERRGQLTIPIGRSAP